MKQRIFLHYLALALLFSACKKRSIEGGGTLSGPVTTEKGTPIGAPDKATIGPAGGILTSIDGKLTITIPPGTVMNTTVFSIQPITNTLYGNAQHIAYRLLPEGTTFNKPVQLQFTYDYDDLETTPEDALTVAWQQANGTWKVEPTRLDKQARTLTVETTHFSDWLKTGGFELRVEKELVKTSEKSKLWIVSVGDDELLAEFDVNAEDNANLTALGKWKIIDGSGDLAAHKRGNKGFEYSATYTAPSTVNGIMYVTITAEAEGFTKIKDPSAPGGVRRLVKIILFGRLLVSNNFMTGTLDGEPFGFFGDKVIASGANGVVLIRAGDASGGLSLTANGTSAGSYACGQIFVPGKGAVLVEWTGGPMYGHSYFECGQAGDLKFSPAAVQITKWPAVGGSAEGSFSGPVYLSDGVCGARQKTLTVQFSVTRTN